MVKALLALTMIPRLINPSQTDITDYVNNYINNTCQYLRYNYNQTTQQYELYDQVNYFNNQNSDTTFNFTIYLDYTITERITHFWEIGDGLTIYLAYGNEPNKTPNIKGNCTKILTLDSEKQVFRTYNLERYGWDTENATVLNEVPASKVTDEIYILNQNYAKNSELYKSGYESGYNIGYNTGYGDGKVATTPLNNAFELFKKISTSLSSFWNIPILPGINLGLLISIPITTGIVIWVIKALKE